MTSVALVVLDTLRAEAFDRAFDWLPGTRFDHAFSTSHWTGPAHASLFTGQYPSEVGVTVADWSFPADSRPLAERLGDAGYTTHAVSTNINVSPAYGWDRGFGTFDGGWRLAQADDEVFNWYRHLESADESITDGAAKGSTLRAYASGLVATLRGSYDTTASLRLGAYQLLREHGVYFDDEGAKWVRRRLRRATFDDPTFLFVNLMETHQPYHVPADYRTVPPYDLGPALGETLANRLAALDADTDPTTVDADGDSTTVDADSDSTTVDTDGDSTTVDTDGDSTTVDADSDSTTANPDVAERSDRQPTGAGDRDATAAGGRPTRRDDRATARRTDRTTSGIDADHARRAYGDCVTYLSAIYRDVFETLRASFDYVVTVADHGESLGEHGVWEHGYGLYPSVTWVPLVVTGPGFAETTRTDPVSLLDVHRTICLLTGIEPVGRGRDLRTVDHDATYLTEYHGIAEMRRESLRERGYGDRAVALADTPRRGLVADGYYGYETDAGWTENGTHPAPRETLAALDDEVPTADRDGRDAVSDAVERQLERLGYK